MAERSNFPACSIVRRMIRESGSLGWVSVLYALASDGVFGDAEKTDRAGLFDVLCLLYDNYHKNRRK